MDRGAISGRIGLVGSLDGVRYRTPYGAKNYNLYKSNEFQSSLMGLGGPNITNIR